MEIQHPKLGKIFKSKCPESGSYINMMTRCYNSGSKNSHGYIDRDITVCDRWIDSFQYFMEDMGARPSDLYSLDRKDNDGNYEPSNCRWATAKEQSNNRRPKSLERGSNCLQKPYNIHRNRLKTLAFYY